MILTAALTLAVVCSALSIMGLGVVVNDAANVLCTPFRAGFNALGSGAENLGKYFSGMDGMIDENSQLRDRIAELERELDLMKYASDENAALRKYIDSNPDTVRLKYIDAALMSVGTESYIDIFTLNRGTADGVRAGMAVVTENGVVGYVCEVSLFSCRVTTIIETDSKTGIYIRRSGEGGILYGDYELKNQNGAYGKYFAEDADIEVGDLVMTSGTGSVYPRDLLVGRVTEVSNDPLSRGKIVKISCSADFERLNRVMIISGWEEDAAETLPEDTSPETDGSGVYG